MKFRIWHTPNVPGNPFYQEVQSLAEAKFVLMTLARYDLYLGDNVISNNAQGLEIFYEAGDKIDDFNLYGDPISRSPTEDEYSWGEWHDANDRDISEATRADPMKPVQERRWR